MHSTLCNIWDLLIFRSEQSCHCHPAACNSRRSSWGRDDTAWIVICLTSTPAEALEEHIASVKPHVLIGNVESLTSTDNQRKISWLEISYIAVDEAQVKFFCRNKLFLQYVSSKVADPERGWSFRPYSPELWRWLRATYQGVPFMLSSATLSTDSLERIKVSLGIDKDEVFVLSSSCDRPNIFQQCRRIPRKVDIWWAICMIEW